MGQRNACDTAFSNPVFMLPKQRPRLLLLDLWAAPAARNRECHGYFPRRVNAAPRARFASK